MITIGFLDGTGPLVKSPYPSPMLTAPSMVLEKSGILLRTVPEVWQTVPNPGK